MSTNAHREVLGIMTGCAIAAIAALAASNAHATGPRLVVDTFTATTANMAPAGLGLRIQIIRWQDADARVEAVASMAAGAEAATPLSKLPTVGYVWPTGSPVGYSLKYAHREPLPGGGERITLVTDKRLGSYDFKGWSAPSPASNNEAPYSVVELVVDESGTGTGTFSLVGAVALDENAGTVTLAPSDGAPSLLTGVKRESPGP